MATIAGNLDSVPGIIGQEVLSVYSTVTTNLTATSTATLSSANVSGVVTSTNTTDSTSASSASALNTAGGLSVAKAANIGNTLGVVGATTLAGMTNSGNESISGTLTVNGVSTLASTTVSSLLNTGNETVNGVLNLPNTITVAGVTASSPTVQGGSATTFDALRIRTNDSTNTGARLSIANSAMGNTYYDSGITLYSLGNVETSTNYEKMAFGVNTNGAYLNYLYGGTGSAKNFNLFGGSVFTTGGSLQLASTLGVSGATTLAAVNVTSMSNSGNETVTGLVTANGGVTTPTVTLPVITLTSGTVSAPIIQGGSNVAQNQIRMRSADTTNTSARMTIANTAMANTYYDSGLSMFNLGSSESSTNYERLSFGINSAGGYLNYLYGGTGAARQFNLYGGAVFTTGGSLQLAGTLGVTGATSLAQLSATNTTLAGTLNVSGVVTSTNTTDSTSASSASALNTAGGLSVAKAANIGGTLGVGGATTLAGMTNSGNESISGTLTVNGVIDGNSTVDATSTTSAAALSSAGGLSVAATTWTKNIVITTPYYAMWYTNTSPTVTKNSVFTMSSGWTLWNTSSSVMTNSFTTTSGTTNTWTAPYTGKYTLSANIRMLTATSTAGVCELWMACTNSSIYGTTANRLGHNSSYCPANTTVSPSSRFSGVFNMNDQVTIAVYNQNSNMTLTLGNDCTFEVVMDYRIN